jgi:hypothetical protein
MVVRHTFPQDGDNNDAEHFGQLVGRDIISDYVEQGLNFTPNYTTPEVTVSNGVCSVKSASETATNSGETVLGVSYVVQLDQQTVALTDSTVNYIYVVPNIGSNDSATISAITDRSNAGETDLLIGTVDTSNDTETEENRSPSTTTFELSSSLRLEDNVPIHLGDDDDVDVKYASSGDALRVEGGSTVDITDADVTDGTNTIYDQSAENVPLSILEADTISVTAGSGIIGGGSPSLGGTVSVSHEDTSTQADVSAGDGEAVTNVVLDDYGHVTSASTASFDGRYVTESGDTMSGHLDMDGNQLQSAELTTDGSPLVVRDTANGSDVLTVAEGGDVAVPDGDISDGTNTVYDQSNSWVPQARLENDSVTVSAGTGIASAGTVSLGDSVTVDIDTSVMATRSWATGSNIAVGDLSGTTGEGSGGGLNADQVDGMDADDIGVDIEDGGTTTVVDATAANFADHISVTDDTDGTVTISLDDDFLLNSGDILTGELDMGGNDLQDGSTVLWDASASYIPQGRLQNDSLTVTAGDGLKRGGSVSLGSSTTIDIEPADFAGVYLSDDGSDNLTVDIGSGITNDGSNNISVDTSTIASRTWVNGNADVPNADYADNADQLDGNHASAFADSSHTHSSLYNSGTQLTVDTAGNTSIAGELTENASI